MTAGALVRKGRQVLDRLPPTTPEVLRGGCKAARRGRAQVARFEPPCPPDPSDTSKLQLQFRCDTPANFIASLHPTTRPTLAIPRKLVMRLALVSLLLAALLPLRQHAASGMICGTQSW